MAWGLGEVGGEPGIRVRVGAYSWPQVAEHSILEVVGGPVETEGAWGAWVAVAEKRSR